ncbi:hypothetical protein BofuT4_P121030.1 [Botrytis cinerea T4]|uniref:Uncharacterized protein n=1 Tax=Botryotinia fuckeliana (strain T4) TaxID=999810 RepID=G2YN86_BOTF4|nr:hypothetical protein BofuT4_P121030.1 [Botrytis cinerea T4]
MNFVQSKPRKAGRLGVTNTLGQLQTTPGFRTRGDATGGE